MARFCTLYSGSSGNSTYIGTGTGGILVDAGVSCKALLTALSARDIRPDTIRGLSSPMSTSTISRACGCC